MFGAILGNVLGAGLGAWSAHKQKKAAEDKERKARREMNRQKQAFSALDTSNPYLNMENTMEDLTINQQAAQMQNQQFQQSQANVLGGMRGAAGGSGVAGVAQALAQQGQLAAQRSAASIGAQESANQRLKQQEAGRLQTQEARGDYDVAQSIAQGEAASQQRELTKQKTLYDAAQEDHQFAQQQQAGAQQAKDEAWSGAISSGVELVGSLAMSDRKLKKNIKLIGKSPSGLKIYAFEYIDKFFGEHVYQGVMSDEIPSDAVINNGSYDKVDYSKIDVEFKIL